MDLLRIRLIYISLIACWLLTNSVFSQSLVRQIHISVGGGVNSSFFDIGAGSPGLSLSASSLFLWTEHWKAGIHFGYHQVEGTDEGSAQFGRGLAYNSELYEYSVRGEYLVFFGHTGGAKWKLSQNSSLHYRGSWKSRIKPFLYAGAGALRYHPYLYYYPTGEPLDENPEFPDWTSIINAGMGIYFYITPYWTVALEIGSNFPFFDYTKNYNFDEFSNSLDMFHNLGIRFTRNQNVGTSVRHGCQRRRR
jgi:hypothetical protein